MSLYKGTTIVSGLPTGLIDNVNSKADANTVYTKNEVDAKPQITAPYLKTSYVNGTSGYRIWSDGYCEQWGQANYPALATNTTGGTSVSFVKTFSNSNYNVLTTIVADGGNSWDIKVYAVSKSTNSMYVSYANTDHALYDTGKFDWRACGYLASGQY